MGAAFHSIFKRSTDESLPDRQKSRLIHFFLKKIELTRCFYRKFSFGFILLVICLMPNRSAWSIGFVDFFKIGTAYLTHLTIHEMGHQLVADEVGATNHKISFFTQKKGEFYLGLSTFDSIPRESRLPYAMGGERMNTISYEYHLEAYRRNPTIFNKTMLFFDATSFLGYTLLANYVNSDNRGYDPTLIRTEIGMSKEVLLSFVATKTLINTWRIFNPKIRWVPILESDHDSIRFRLQYCF
jgi:hypothetical protein